MSGDSSASRSDGFDICVYAGFDGHKMQIY